MNTMQHTIGTRSGKTYLKPHVCNTCKTFYSNEKTGYMCSQCFQGTIKPYATPQQIREFVSSKTLNTEEENLIIAFLKKNNKTFALMLLKHWSANNCFEAPYNGKWITAQLAKKIIISLNNGQTLERRSIQKEDVYVMNCVFDWWNVIPVFGKHSHYSCYFGRYTEDAPLYLPISKGPKSRLHMLQSLFSS